MGRHLSTQQFDQVLQRLSLEYDIYAPKRFEKQGRFSDTDVIRYDTIETLDEIVWDEKSTFSPKDVVIPVTQTLFFFTEEEYREPKASDRKILVFLRPCDINGFRRLDTIYLRNGEDPDFYYKRLRERIKFVMMECRESFDNCFCVSMGSNSTDEYSMAVRFGEDSLQLDVPDESLQPFFDPDMAETDFTPEFVQKNKQVVTPPEVQEMPPEVFDHEMWAQYKKRCIACGRCTTHCDEIWNQIVGESVSKNAQPSAFKGRLLLVEVNSSVWMHQLQFLKEDIIRKINETMGEEVVEDIKFKIGTL